MRPWSKRAQEEVGMWKTSENYILLAIALVIIFIIFKMIISRIKNLYF